MHNDYVSGPAYTAHLFAPFNGIIDEVKLYNRALTLGEIQKDYQRTSVVAYDAESSTAFLRTRIQSAALWRNYYPFGQTMAGRSSTSITDPRCKFTEKERDVETGYDYFGARYYDARIGRWLAVDPLAEKYPHLSSYQYTGSNPIRLLDPNGREIVEHNSVRNSEFLRTAIEIAKTTSIGRDLYNFLDAVRHDVLVILCQGSPPNAGAEVLPVGREPDGSGIYGGTIESPDITVPSGFPQNPDYPHNVGRDYYLMTGADEVFHLHQRALYPIALDEVKLSEQGMEYAVAAIVHEWMHVFMMLDGVSTKGTLMHEKMGHRPLKGDANFNKGIGWTAIIWGQVKEAVARHKRTSGINVSKFSADKRDPDEE